MKRFIEQVIVVCLLIGLIAACGPRPQYKTAKGKKKMKYYNSIQYDRAPLPKSNNKRR
ncbi:MAG: hypothetical protein RLO12_19510 [Fulvivirga sp.]|uniref:hypothetical protein n=1 Tax=Fulvivirga sp. TaxID=1931237 RepID=UPI0032EF2933